MPKLFFVSLFLILTLLVVAQQTAVTPTEAKELSSKIETAVNDGDTSFLHKLIDSKSLLKKIETKSIALKNAGVRRGFSETFSMAHFGDQTIASAKGGGCKQLRNYEKDGVQHLLFRIYGDGGFNYEDFALVKIDNVLKAEDMYSYISGEDLSTTLTTMLDVEFSSVDSKEAVSEDAKAIKQIGEYKKQKNYNGQKDLIEKLDRSVQNTKGIQLLYIDACRHINRDYYKTALDNYVSLFPNEANGYLMMIDVYFLNKEYERAVIAVDKLDSLIGGDPYLDFYRGLLYKQMGKFDESKADFEKCFGAEPSIVKNMQQLADSYYREGDYKKAKGVINTYKRLQSFKPEDLAPLYKAYPSLKDSL